MKLLIITQKVDKNDDVLGFFHGWIIEFAKHFEKVSVICLGKGEYDLPDNVTVYSLGKEQGASRFEYLRRFYTYIFSQKNEYDTVFVHMNQIYVLLGGIFWRFWNKKIGLWYVHRQTTISLWLAEKIATSVLTAAPESFNLRSKKLQVLGHGIITELYNQAPYHLHGGTKILLQVGRITPIKRCELALQALSVLEQKYPSEYIIRFIGKPITDTDREYGDSLKTLASSLHIENSVTFVGALSPIDIITEYKNADASLNFAPTGGIDKVVLESMAAGRVSFSTNKAFIPYFEPFENQLILSSDPDDIASKIHSVMSGGDMVAISDVLKKTVKEMSSLSNLISRIATILQ